MSYHPDDSDEEFKARIRLSKHVRWVAFVFWPETSDRLVVRAIIARLLETVNDTPMNFW